MKKSIKYFAIAQLFTIMMSSSVLAAPLSNQLQEQNNQLSQSKDNLKRFQEQEQTIEEQVEMFDNQIEAVMGELDENNAKIKATEEKISVAQKQLDEARDDIDAEKQLFGQRMRALYTSDNNSYLSIILKANGFGDLISRMQAIAKIAEYDNKILTNLKDKQEEIDKNKKELQNENDKLAALKAGVESKLAKLNADKEDQNKLLVKAKEQESLLADNVNQSQAEVNATIKMIQDAEKSAANQNSSGAVSGSNSSTSSSNFTNASNNEVIQYAMQFLGTPYLWGGTTPAGFDCSGFTQYVYRHFGVSLGRTTFEQIKNGTAVSRDQLQPGDLVFFGTWDNPHHMGMYVGNGMYIHAPHTGDIIKISPMSRGDYVTARRVR